MFLASGPRDASQEVGHLFTLRTLLAFTVSSFPLLVWCLGYEDRSSATYLNCLLRNTTREEDGHASLERHLEEASLWLTLGL